MADQGDRARGLRLDDRGHVGRVGADAVGALPHRAAVAPEIRREPPPSPGALDEREQALPDRRVGPHAVEEDEERLAPSATRRPDPPLRGRPGHRHLALALPAGYDTTS